MLSTFVHFQLLDMEKFPCCRVVFLCCLIASSVSFCWPVSHQTVLIYEGINKEQKGCLVVQRRMNWNRNLSFFETTYITIPILVEEQK